MERNLYRFTATRHGDKIETTLEYYPSDNEAIKIAKEWEEAFTEDIKVKAERIMPSTRDNDSCPIFMGIYETDNAKKRLALTERQKAAVKAIYKAIEKAQNIGVRFVEAPNYGIYAFNGQDVDDWDIEAHSEDTNVVSFEDLAYVGPPMYEQSAFNNELYIKFKE